MKLKHHKNLSVKKWKKLTLPEQMANIGAEVGRGVIQRKKGNEEYAMLAFERALELFDITRESYPHRLPVIRELSRAREIYCDYFLGENSYNSDSDSLDRYFLQFNLLARNAK